MTLDLVSWLLSDDGPIAEDERVAQIALEIQVATDLRLGPDTHIGRWNPARVLSECAAKRRIIEAYIDTKKRADEQLALTGRTAPDPESGMALVLLAKVAAFAEAIGAFSQVYRGRPGWLEEWAT